MLGRVRVIENMDSRKGDGRDVVELERFFAALPEAGFALMSPTPGRSIRRWSLPSGVAGGSGLTVVTWTTARLVIGRSVSVY